MGITLEGMKNRLEGIRRLLPIGQTIRREDLLCHLAGLELDREGALHLLALELDPEYGDWLDAQNSSCSCKEKPPLTRRQALSICENPPFRRAVEGGVREIFFGERGLKPSQWEAEYGAESQAALFFRLLDQGWDPGELAQWRLDRLAFSRWTFEGGYERIPDVDCQAPIRFVMEGRQKAHLVELPLRLAVGQGTEKITVTDKTSGETFWIQILQTRLENMWRKMENVFAEHRRRGQIPPEHIDQMEAKFQRDFASICPRGMVYPVIEYQCQGDFQLDFYLRDYLDSPEQSSGAAMVFLTRPEQNQTPEGRNIQAAVLQQPVAPDTGEIQAELFCRYVVEEGRVVTTDSREQESRR